MIAELHGDCVSLHLNIYYASHLQSSGFAENNGIIEIDGQNQPELGH